MSIVRKSHAILIVVGILAIGCSKKDDDSKPGPTPEPGLQLQEMSQIAGTWSMSIKYPDGHEYTKVVFFPSVAEENGIVQIFRDRLLVAEASLKPGISIVDRKSTVTLEVDEILLEKPDAEGKHPSHFFGADEVWEIQSYGSDELKVSTQGSQTLYATSFGSDGGSGKAEVVFKHSDVTKLVEATCSIPEFANRELCSRPVAENPICNDELTKKVSKILEFLYVDDDEQEDDFLAAGRWFSYQNENSRCRVMPHNYLPARVRLGGVQKSYLNNRTYLYTVFSPWGKANETVTESDGIKHFYSSGPIRTLDGQPNEAVSESFFGDCQHEIFRKPFADENKKDFKIIHRGDDLTSKYSLELTTEADGTFNRVAEGIYSSTRTTDCLIIRYHLKRPVKDSAVAGGDAELDKMFEGALWDMLVSIPQ